MEEIKSCNKVKSGTMEYAINRVDRYLRLVSDCPGIGSRGSWHDQKTKIPFEAINGILDTKGSIETRDFACLFQVNSSNNGPMLVAALMNEQCLVKGSDGQFYVKAKRL